MTIKRKYKPKSKNKAPKGAPRGPRLGRLSDGAPVLRQADNPFVYARTFPSSAVLDCRLRLEAFEVDHAPIFTERVVVFLNEYAVNGFDAGRAAAAAGAPAPKSTPSERRAWAATILANPIVREGMRLRGLIDYYTRRVTRDRLMEELEAIALSNMADYLVRAPGGLPTVDFDLTNRRAMAAVSKYTVKEMKEGRGTSAADVLETRFELHDKKGAIIELLKRLDAEDTPRIADNLDPPMISASAYDTPTSSIRFVIEPIPSGQFIGAPVEPPES